MPGMRKTTLSFALLFNKNVGFGPKHVNGTWAQQGEPMRS
jgi:hypothetical protein